MHRFRHSAVLPHASRVLCLLLALLSLSCGGRRQELAAPLAEGDLLRSRSASVRILPETYLAGGSARAITLTEREEGGDVLLELRAQEAQQLKALYLHLEYDPEQLSPAGVDSAWAFAAQEDSLQLSLAGQPGVLEYGEQCIRPQEAGQSAARKGMVGDGLLCTIRFTKRPFIPLQREAAAPTIAARSQSFLSLNVDTFELNWGYASNGDYNQNGTVAVTDLTPIGAHFLEEVPDGDQNSIEAVIDGNGNGEIGISDLTAIGLNFGITVNSYNVYASRDIADIPTENAGPNGPGAELRGTVPFSAVQGDQFAARRSFSFTLAQSQIGWFYWVRPNDAEDGTGADGTPSSVASFGGKPENLDPLAVLSADPTSGDIPLEVSFDASGSSDPDGLAGDISDIVQFQWDFDGNGLIDDVSSEPTISHTYRRGGLKQARVRVFDSGAASSEAAVSILAGAAGNEVPVAVLNASLSSGQVPLTVLFSTTGSGSGDAVSNVIQTEFDFEGDGIFDVASGFLRSEISHTFTEIGTFNTTVRITDSFQLQSTASIEITVTPNAGNQAPVIGIQPDPLVFDLVDRDFQVVEIDVSGCSDPDGTVQRIELDVRSDGFPEAFYQNDGIRPPDRLFVQVVPMLSTITISVVDDLGTQTQEVRDFRVSKNGNFPPQLALSQNTVVGDKPLQVDFDASASTDIDGSIVNFRFEFNDSSPAVDDPDGVLSHIFESGGDFFVSITAVDDDGLEASVNRVIEVNAPNNQPPQAAFSLSVSSGDAPLTVTIDPSASSDPDGSINELAWDFSGDGFFAPLDDPTSLAPFEQTFVQDGIRQVSLRVTDNDGGQDTFSLPLTISGGIKLGVAVQDFSQQRSDNDTLSAAVIPAGNSGLDKAAIAFVPNRGENVFPFSAFYTECQPADPLQWSTPSPVFEMIDENGDGFAQLGFVARNIKLLEVAGNPALAFDGNGKRTDELTAPSEDGVFFVRAEDNSGSLWGDPVKIPLLDGDLEGEFNNTFVFEDIAAAKIVSGRPAVAYDFTRGDFQRRAVRYARALDSLGSQWPPPVEVDSVPDNSIFFSDLNMEVFDGVPSLLFARNTNSGSPAIEQPSYSRAVDSEGSAWSLPESVEDGDINSVRSRGSLLLRSTGGLPAAFYNRPDGQSQGEVGSSVSGGFSGPPTVVPFDSGSRMQVIDLFENGGDSYALLFGFRSSALNDGFVSSIFLSRALSEDLSSWGNPVVVANSGSRMSALSAAVLKLNGDLVIIFADSDAANVKVAVLPDFVGF